jgi:hypothetical protein
VTKENLIDTENKLDTTIIENENSSNAENKTDLEIRVNKSRTNAPSVIPDNNAKFQSILANKKRIIHRYFDELSQTYFQSHNRDLKDFSLKGQFIKQNYFIKQNSN